MIRRIIEFSARNRALVLLGFAALCVFAFYTLKQIRLDALPDLSDTQVIVYSRWDRSPDLVEDQVTYPIVTAMLGAPGVRAVRVASEKSDVYPDVDAVGVAIDHALHGQADRRTGGAAVGQCDHSAAALK